MSDTGERGGDVADLTAKAYEIIRMIPPGHVTSYGQLLPGTRECKVLTQRAGHIAKLAGYPRYSR